MCCRSTFKRMTREQRRRLSLRFDRQSAGPLRKWPRAALSSCSIPGTPTITEEGNIGRLIEPSPSLRGRRISRACAHDHLGRLPHNPRQSHLADNNPRHCGGPYHCKRRKTHPSASVCSRKTAIGCGRARSTCFDNPTQAAETRILGQSVRCFASRRCACLDAMIINGRGGGTWTVCQSSE